MSTRWFTVRKHDDQPPGVDLSRLLVLGFLVAALLGLVTGMGWVGCNLFRTQFGG